MPVTARRTRGILEISNAVYELGYGSQKIPALPQEALEYIANNEGSFGGGEEEEYEEDDYEEDAEMANTAEEPVTEEESAE